MTQDSKLATPATANSIPTTKQQSADAVQVEAMKIAVVDAIEDIKGFDITVMDVRKLTSMTVYMIVASANSSRQAKSIADNVREKLKGKGFTIRGTEGEKEGEWVLVDLDDIVVHIMVPTTRAYYNLEQLWGEAEGRRGHIKVQNQEIESHVKAAT